MSSLIMLFNVIYVFFPDEPKIGVKTIKNYIKRLVQDDKDKAIMLIQENLTPFAKRFISEMRSKYYLEVFQEEELSVQAHVLVPEHKDLKNEENRILKMSMFLVNCIRYRQSE
ncbi:putative DNA-directed RNA polymerase RPB5 subunit, eukaryote/virus [Rosa chinensis]|uniref:Putative DNA-directed RNA polymerase RPB5 subunit, eukaryote/virus n=1 Tax=Rosa chinensis TaxID=74649 RepID=A0A2P6SEU5_ROSCH|nr:putative DNA-directed RNA polymerase RPB5 subunit, eukaryote/virus [Rosa chinensis]